MEKNELSSEKLSSSEDSNKDSNIITIQVKVKDETQKDAILNELVKKVKSDVVAKGYGCVLLDGVVFEIE